MEQNGGLRPGQCYRFGWDAASGELAMTIVGTAAAICGQARPYKRPSAARHWAQHSAVPIRIALNGCRLERRSAGAGAAWGPAALLRV